MNSGDSRITSCSIRRQWILVLLLSFLLITFHGFAWGQESSPKKPDATPESAVTASQETELKLLAQEIEALKRIMEGKLPEGLEMRRLFNFDLRSIREINKQKQAIHKTLAGFGRTKKNLSKQTPSTPRLLADLKIIDMQIESQTLRLAFLNAPKPRRLEVVEAEDRRLAELLTKEANELRDTVKLMQQVAEGKLPEGIEVRSLFEVNLLDPDAVAKRKEYLSAQVEMQAQTVAALIKAKQTQAASKDQSVQAKKQEPIPKPNLEQLENEVTILRHQINILRLSFLSQSPEKISDVLEAEEKKRRISEAEAAAQQARLEAELKEREAEQAHQAALEQAHLAASIAEKKIATERARVEQARALLATLHRRFATDRQRFADQTRIAWQMLEGFQQRLNAAMAEQAEIDALFREVVLALSQYRRELRQALHALKQPSQVMTYELDLDPNDPALQSAPEDKAALLQAVFEIQHDEADLKIQEIEMRRARLDEFAGDVRYLTALRLEMLPLLSSRLRQSVFGLSQEGINELIFEVDYLQLMTLVHVHSRFYLRNDWRSAWGNVATLSKVGVGLVKLLLVLVAFAYLRRRSVPLLQRLRGTVLRGNGNRLLRITAHRWLSMMIALAPDLGLLFFVYLFFWVLGSRDVQEIAIIRTLALAYAWYRLSLSVPHWLITSAVTSRRIRVSAELSDRIQHSFRLVARYAFPVIVFLDLSHRMIGAGYLYRLVVSFFWLGAIPIAVVLLHWWREPITRSVQRYYPKSRLTKMLQSKKNRWLLLIGIPVAFIMVAGWGLRKYGSDLLSRFRHTRKALAFIFRRQLEKKAEAVGHRDVHLFELPAGLRQAFTEEPVVGDLAIENFPLQDRLLKRLNGWWQMKNGCSAALVGAGGVGKTTWLKRLVERTGEFEVVQAEIDEDIHSEEKVCRHLNQILNLPDSETTAQVRDALLAGPRRLIVLDECENFVLRAVGGLAGFDAFGDIVGRTVPHIAWVCSFSKYVWEFVDSVCLSNNIFSEVLKLKPWDEKTIDTLLTSRMRKADVNVSYDDLIIDRVDGTEFASEVIRTGERYRQLLWDYADGLPRMAIHFWLRSLEPVGENSVKVHLFTEPEADQLENLNEPSRFLLAAVVTHGNLTVSDASRVLNYPESVCELLINSLVARGILRNAGERYRISSFWDRAVHRYLRRKHLLYF